MHQINEPTEQLLEQYEINILHVAKSFQKINQVYLLSRSENEVEG